MPRGSFRILNVFCHFRYCGYCPQFKYQIGETFGRTTSSLLTNDIVASSGKPVLADIEPELPPKRDNRRATIAARTFSLGDQKLTEQMVPGYTGKLVQTLRKIYYKSLVHSSIAQYSFRPSCCLLDV